MLFRSKTLSQYLTYLRSVHLIAAKHILRYLKGTIDYGLKYEANQKINLKFMLIQIGQAVASIGRALQGAASLWDQV